MFNTPNKLRTETIGSNVCVCVCVCVCVVGVHVYILYTDTVTDLTVEPKA